MHQTYKRTQDIYLIKHRKVQHAPGLALDEDSETVLPALGRSTTCPPPGPPCYTISGTGFSSCNPVMHAYARYIYKYNECIRKD